MKKLIVCVLSLMMVLALAGCTSSNSSLNSDKDTNTITATFENSDTMSMGYIVVNKGENVVIKCDLESGSFNLQFAVDKGDDEDVDVTEETIPAEDLVAEADFSQSEEKVLKEIPAGSYKVLVSAKDKATGSLEVSTEKK